MEAIQTAPNLEDFTPLSEHQEQTPGTFFGGKPVLHAFAPASTLKVPSDQFDAQPDIKRLAGSNIPSLVEGNYNLHDVDVWVTSRNLILFSQRQTIGLQIPYPTITITAQDGADVLLELNLSAPDTADEDIEFVQLRIHPTTVSHNAQPADTTAGAGTNGTTAHNDSATALWKAISDCQELNPDPVGDDEEEGEGFDETAPGATGWITSENMADFMDENGNFRMPEGMTVIGGEEAVDGEPLGEGAGRRRTADEANAQDGAEEDESKWQRTG